MTVSAENERTDPERVDERARELVHGGDEGRAPVVESDGATRRAAERILEESEERTMDPATANPEDDSVIRRTSEETA